ncbi:MAG: tetratricopeptide repeat protein [Proteobacteria bacterium]|nr:tetratricopeptide repeat protein [Pseudomonadota bacterium]MBU1709075.1 tetratricopeptide repeat protein [Pseudomonadota bacterium]
MTSPLFAQNGRISIEDLNRFKRVFSETIKYFLSCSRVDFIPVNVDESAPLPPGVKSVQKRRIPCIGENGVLYLPIWRVDELIATAVLGDCSSKVLEADGPWLLERSRFISREFEFGKQLSLDPLTGLLNKRHLLEELTCRMVEGSGPTNAGMHGFVLALIEICPAIKDADQARQYIARAASCLGSLEDRVALHHLGSGVFGLIWEELDSEGAIKVGNAVLNWLKRENFPRIRIGLAPVNDQTMHEGKDAAGVVEQAWHALETARKRGPYGLCSSSALINAEQHPLKPLPARVTAYFRKLLPGVDAFAVILLQQDQDAEGAQFSGRVRSLLIDTPLVPVNPREAFVFIAGADQQRALDWIQSFKKKLGKDMGSFSMGVALFPDHDFRKSEMLLNARKALLHTNFFGPDTVTVFDGISLNISGDIYYNEGDLAAAAKEYKKGLEVDPDNVNLLNSMGVTWAQMNRYRDAIPYFEKALGKDNDDFMALFNMGLALLALNRNDAVIPYFERAYKVDPHNFDLILQLGRLYCQSKRYDEAVMVLKQGEGKGNTGSGRDVGRGALHRYLGEAYMASGKNKKAMASLQRACNHNPRDASALSLLGELYDLEKQGAEIATALSRQAVELDSSRWEYWYRLGKIQFHQGNTIDAKESLKESLRLHRKNIEASVVLGEVYRKSGQHSKAQKMFMKVLRLDPAHKQAKQSLKKLAKA